MTKNLPQCVICKINLNQIQSSLFKCSNCNREYVLDYEVMAYEPTFGSVHSDNPNIELEGIGSAGTGFETADQELDWVDKKLSYKEQEEPEEDIYGNPSLRRLPKYLKEQPGKEIKYELKDPTKDDL